MASMSRLAKASMYLVFAASMASLSGMVVMAESSQVMGRGFERYRRHALVPPCDARWQRGNPHGSRLELFEVLTVSVPGSIKSDAEWIVVYMRQSRHPVFTRIPASGGVLESFDDAEDRFAQLLVFRIGIRSK